MRWVAILGVLLTACATFPDLQAQSVIGPFGEERVTMAGEPGEPMEAVASDGTPLHGYLVRAKPSTRRRGLVVLLHGLGGRAHDWRHEAMALAERGIDVTAWDGRGHGASGGRCSYGLREAGDLRRELDVLTAAGVDTRRTVLYGYSMGASVALAAAAAEPRVRGVMAVAPFARLDDAIRRVLWAAPRWVTNQVVASAESRGRFSVAAVRPVEQARRIRVPLLLVMGAVDERAPPEDGFDIARAAAGGTRLLIVPGANHDDVLRRCGAPCDRALGELLREAGMN